MKQPHLGRKIVELRKAKGLTQEELVEKCNLSVRTLQRIESGEVTPRSYTIKIIFAALDYNLNYDSRKTKSNRFSDIKFAISGGFGRFKKYAFNLFNLKTNIMKNQMGFFKNFFLAIGVVWFLCGLSIVIFELNFQTREIILTLVLPLAYAILREFDKSKPSDAG